jgi:putative ABC transport system ATP-binding protein
MIKLKNIHKSYFLGGNEEKVLKGIDLHVDDGEMIALMGPSGSGKSTLMNIIGLLDHPDTGEYLLNYEEISGLSTDKMAGLRNRYMGFVFQSFFLLSRLTALQNVCLPMVYRERPQAEVEALALDKLSKVGMKDLHFHRPNQLSGGQQQRVAIARALVGNPKVILADEPTGALDSKTGQEVLDLLMELNQKEKTTIIVVTHDQHVAKQCGRIVHLKDGMIE